MNSKDTICALATAPGGALGIIRVSGPDAFAAVSSVCSVRCECVAANTVHYTHITDGTEVIDEAMVTVFRAPHSYTGEDSVEISCHGSRYILNKVLELLMQNGCRMATPGEYTMRAYLNGKLDLSQAEAVADLIASTNRVTHHLAMSQLRGGISSQLATLREQLLKLTSLLELELDFSDHEDLEFADRTELQQLANTINHHITQLAHSFETGQALKQGIPVAIVGKTNVGKSTLLNRLLNDERAIVSDIHGTTRDTIEDVMDIRGVQFRFIDTAGIRQTEDQVEQIGIQRTYQAIEKARIVLWLIDEHPIETEIHQIIKHAQGRPLIIVWNKSDLGNIHNFPSPIPNSQLIEISAKYGTNIPALEQAIYEAADIPTLTDTDVIITNARHYDSLIRAQQNLSRVINGLTIDTSGDLLSEDLRLVLSDLTEITGKGQITPTEVLGNIFQNFCVGK
ncbi:MAG: tRNA uridine-5-carboxymethylaminomethyl(34) synthesis GTPase MnmE [Prevotella sp.]|nr:tRNA uridine-5-carboxymethylaminomethyl(34) synthesis GTPase MnmE [Prevotella sp.]